MIRYRWETGYLKRQFSQVQEIIHKTNRSAHNLITKLDNVNKLYSNEMDHEWSKYSFVLLFSLILSIMKHIHSVVCEKDSIFKFFIFNYCKEQRNLWQRHPHGCDAIDFFINASRYSITDFTKWRDAAFSSSNQINWSRQ